MKVTREMVQRIRAAFPGDGMASFIGIDRGELQALLDERKALREALLSIMGGDAYSVAYAALALGEDEE